MKNKKALIIILIIVLLISLAVLAYAIIDSMFPEAAPISYPDAGSITEFLLIQNNGSSINIEPADFREFLQNTSNSQPTRTWSVQDYPTVQTYYTLELSTPDRFYRYFIYTENSQVYIEHPYEGVYKTTQQFLDSVTEYFNK